MDHDVVSARARLFSTKQERYISPLLIHDLFCNSESENFELDLFQDYMPNVFTLLRDNDAAKYLPELTSSMAIKCVNVNSSENTEDSVSGNWKRMNRFEGSICGGTLRKSNRASSRALLEYLIIIR